MLNMAWSMSDALDKNAYLGESGLERWWHVLGWGHGWHRLGRWHGHAGGMLTGGHLVAGGLEGGGLFRRLHGGWLLLEGGFLQLAAAECLGLLLEGAELPGGAGLALLGGRGETHASTFLLAADSRVNINHFSSLNVQGFILHTNRAFYYRF